MAEQIIYNQNCARFCGGFAAGNYNGNVINYPGYNEPDKMNKLAKDVDALKEDFEKRNNSENEANETSQLAIQRNPGFRDADIKKVVTKKTNLKQRLRKAGEATCIEAIKISFPPIAPIIAGIKAYINPE